MQAKMNWTDADKFHIGISDWICFYIIPLIFFIVIFCFVQYLKKWSIDKRNEKTKTFREWLAIAAINWDFQWSFNRREFMNRVFGRIGLVQNGNANCVLEKTSALAPIGFFFDELVPFISPEYLQSKAACIYASLPVGAEQTWLRSHFWSDLSYSQVGQCVSRLSWSVFCPLEWLISVLPLTRREQNRGLVEKLGAQPSVPLPSQGLD